MTRGRRGWIAAGVGLLVVGVGSVAALAGLGAGGGGALPAPHYTEEAAAAGLVHAYDGEFFYFVGGGVAVFDCDGDGRQDLYLAGGEEPAALFRNRSPVGGALAFDPVPSPATDLEQVVGAYPIDIDADGNVDLAVLRVGENVLLRGLGGCAFERANEAWGFDGGDAWTTAFAASWEDPDALPTLAFGNYLKPETVDDGSYVCDDDQLVRPDASGRQLRAAERPVAELLQPVDAVQRLGSLRPPRPARLERPRVLPSARRGAAVAHDAGCRTAALHAAPRAGSRFTSGAWGSPRTT